MGVKRNAKLHKLKYWREVAGFMQADFAVLLGCTVQNYSLKESGKTELKRGEMIALQSALNKEMEKSKGVKLSLDDIFLP